MFFLDRPESLLTPAKETGTIKQNGSGDRKVKFMRIKFLGSVLIRDGSNSRDDKFAGYCRCRFYNTLSFYCENRNRRVMG